MQPRRTVIAVALQSHQDPTDNRSHSHIIHTCTYPNPHRLFFTQTVRNSIDISTLLTAQTARQDYTADT
ncbi:hypothetical protein CPB97_004089, partial [Podila verticillata]